MCFAGVFAGDGFGEDFDPECLLATLTSHASGLSPLSYGTHHRAASTCASSDLLPKEDAVSDIAIVRCTHNIVGDHGGFSFNNQRVIAHIRPATLSTQPPREGENIRITGFPLGIIVPVTVQGIIASSFFKDEKVRNVYLANVFVNHGDSGGPAYFSDSANVFGFVVEYRPAPEGNSGLAVIVPINKVVELAYKVTPDLRVLPGLMQTRSPGPQKQRRVAEGDR